MTVSRPVPTRDSVVANLRVAGSEDPGSVRELCSGFDALYLSARAILGPLFLEHLENRRRWADRVRLATPCEIGEEIFAMAPHAWGRYRYCLEHRMARIGLTTSDHLPTVRVQPRAEALHSLGPKGTVEALTTVLSPALGQLSWSVSRVDLFSDFQGFEVSAGEAARFICRADARTTFEMAGRFTGFTFGSRKSKTITARLYDKTADVEANGGDVVARALGRRLPARSARLAPRVRGRQGGTRRVRALGRRRGPRRRRGRLGVRDRRVAHDEGSP
ncbi:MAG TPA: hypothetical protein VND62_10650 [Acidimicrobiales bacterium]|nr:hypothetical protein [Acidimicrobiales bacterium]